MNNNNLRHETPYNIHKISKLNANLKKIFYQDPVMLLSAVIIKKTLSIISQMHAFWKLSRVTWLKNG